MIHSRLASKGKRAEEVGWNKGEFDFHQKSLDNTVSCKQGMFRLGEAATKHVFEAESLESLATA